VRTLWRLVFPEYIYVMVEKKLLPGTLVAIVGGKYRHLFGVLHYEMDMRCLVLVGGMDRAQYLSKNNVVDAMLAVTGNKVATSVKDFGEPLLDTNVESLSLLLEQLNVVKELIQTAQQILEKCEDEVIQIKSNK
jgi:hypothetical protein